MNLLTIFSILIINLKKSKLASFSAQSKPVFERPILDRFDHQINAIHNPHLLIWNSLLFHGAFSPKIEYLTRKSLTSHFYLAKDKL